MSTSDEREVTANDLTASIRCKSKLSLEEKRDLRQATAEEAKVEHTRILRLTAQAKCQRKRRAAIKKNPELHKVAKKVDRRRKRAERTVMKKNGLKENWGSKRISRKVSHIRTKRKLAEAAMEEAKAEGNYLFSDLQVVLEENKSFAKDNVRWEEKYARQHGEMEAKLIELRGECSQLSLQLQTVKAEKVELHKKNEAWFRERVERWMATMENGKKDL